MQHWKASILGLVISIAVVSSASAKELVVAITAAAPKFSEISEDGKRIGFNVDFVRSVCERMGRTCRLETHRFPEVIPKVASAKADIGVANTLKTPERAEKVAFTVPYWRSTSSFVGRAGTSLPAAATEPRLTVCAVKGSRQMAYLKDHRTDSMSPVGVDGIKTLTDGLKKGDCALALVPTLQILTFLQSEQGSPFTYLDRPLSGQGLGGGVHMVVSPDDPNLLAEINRTIKSLVDDGTHERLSRLYFPFGIY